MSYIHQEDDKSENLWSKLNEDRDRKFNIFSDFELLIVECGFQDKEQTTLGYMFALINISVLLLCRSTSPIGQTPIAHSPITLSLSTYYICADQPLHLKLTITRIAIRSGLSI